MCKCMERDAKEDSGDGANHGGRGAKRKTCDDDQGEGEKGREGREKLTFLGAFEENALPM
jgi:hypothetical protein